MENLEEKTLQTCSICSDKTLGEYLESCSGCSRESVCEGCFLKEPGGSGKRCFECAVPFCEDCGWESRKTSDLKFLMLIEENLGFKVCPVCDSPNIAPVIDDDTPPTEIPDVFKKFLATVDLKNI